MKWIKFKIKTLTEAEDIIISTLYDIGLEGAQIEDKVPLTAAEKEQMFVDILPETEEDDGVAYLSFFVEDIDWINNWKEYFHQFYIDDVLVIPSWEEVKEEDRDKMILHIDPGTAFGTGMHETTQLCIRQLRKHITEETKLLDVGTGSGILSILSLMFGAKEATGTDLDPCAAEAVEENKRANHIPDSKFQVMTGNLITEKEVQDKVGYGCYDIVVANILADVLVALTPAAVECLKPGGIYITSGIIDEKEGTVAEAVRKAGMEVIETTYQGEWVSITARKA